MSRENRERKRRRRRERAGRQTLVREPLRRMESVRDLRRLHHLTYEITTEPIETAQSGEPPPHVREALRDAMNDLHEAVFKDPARALSQLDVLIERYPDWPLLYNWLAVSYSRLGDTKRAESAARRLYERNPDYLFAKVNYSQFLLRRGEIDAVAEVFEHKFDLKLLYPHRSVFHLSEFIAFCGVMVEYFMRTNEIDAAHSLFDALDEMAPDHEVTQGLRKVIEGSLLLRLARRLSLLGLGRNRRRS